MASFLDDMDPICTVAELAAYFRTGEDWIREGCRKRQLPWTRRGKSYGFTRADVEEIIRRRAAKPKTVPTRDEVAERRRQVRRAA